uniref:Uncharacterized protein n=1 Tax=viral metagenome TaxID=1070528 RepID=A0A6C0HC16_9ZZZZ
MENPEINLAIYGYKKVYLLDHANKVSKIFVFSGNSDARVENKKLFSDNELLTIKNDNPEIIHSELRIHNDDSIYTIKMKIINTLSIHATSVGFDEIYLFSLAKQKINWIKFYNEMTKNNELECSADMFAQLLLNMNIPQSFIDNLPPKTVYTYDDFYKLNAEFNEVFRYIPIGQRFNERDDLLFSANPYDILPPHVFDIDATNPLLILDNSVLLNYGELVDNVIYLSSAEHLFHYASENGIPEDYIAKIYYQLLTNNDIVDSSKLMENKDFLLRKNNELEIQKHLHLFKKVDLFYDIYNHRSSELPYITNGIHSFHITLHPSEKTTFPLEAIFKSIHVSREMPYVKYNPGLRRENIYRLYSEKYSKTGKKIPYLQKSFIMQLSKLTSKHKQITFFVKKTFRNIEHSFFIDFESNGNIQVKCILKQQIQPNELEELLKFVLNPMILYLNEILEPNGYMIQLLENMQQNVEIVDLHMSFSIHVGETPIQLNKLKGCLTSLFVVPSNLDDKNTEMTFKRVENFQEMNEITKMIRNVYEETGNERAILDNLIENFGMNEMEAFSHISTFLNSFTRINGKFVNNDSNIAEMAGFPTKFGYNPFSKLFVIDVENINATEYITPISIYIDSILRIFLEPSTIDMKKLNTICSKKIEDIKPVVPTVVSNKIQPITFKKADLSFLEDDEEDIGDSNDEIKEIIANNEEEEEEDDELTNAAITERVIEAISGESREPTVPSHAPSLSSRASEDEEDDGLVFMDDEESREPTVLSDAPSLSSKMVEDEEDNGVVFMDDEESREPTVPLDEPSLSSREDNGVVFMDDNEKISKDPNSSNESGVVFMDDDDETNTPEREGSSKGTVGSLEKGVSGGTVGSPEQEHLDKTIFKKNNIFFNKMIDKDSKLFKIEEKNGFSSYPRVCPTNVNLQPVILTQEDKDRIDRENPNSYGKALKYGSDPDKQHYFICPRYWCLKTNSSISEEDVKAGKCGKVLPPNSDGKPIPPGHYVYEFTDNKYHKDVNGNYIQHYPGFKSSSKHPDGLCLPCCFAGVKDKNGNYIFDSELQKKRREQCMNPETDKLTEEEQKTNYILGVARIPLLPKRFGFLPPSVELFFGINHEDLITPTNAALIKPNTNALLRCGVEKNTQKSFIACLADLYADINDKASVPTIAEMLEIIKNAITLDMFLKYHNGSIASTFQPKKKRMVDIEEIEKYKDTQFYKSIDQTNEAQMDFLEDTVLAFENFLKYLTDETSHIDYTYLWDIVSSPNTKLFNEGLNLLILHIPNKDITDDIEIICPTNPYSNKLYDKRKETVIFLKQENFFEPIYLYKINEKGDTTIRKTFHEATANENIKRILHIVENNIGKCLPKSSMPNVYKFKQNVYPIVLFGLLKQYNYTVVSQIMNYQGKIIGLNVNKPEKANFFNNENKDTYFVPCYPSSQLEDIPILYMENNSWNEYEKTRDFLLELNVVSKNEILCKPAFKILEDGLIVGILTETNQFIQISPPQENIMDDGIEIINHSNYLLADAVITTKKEQDEERINVTTNITLESKFYYAFRNTIRTLLNQYENKEIREKILEMSRETTLNYKDKLIQIEYYVKNISKKSFVFAEIEPEILAELDEITTCTTNSKNKSYCLLQDDSHKLILPKKHLISGMDNKTVYYSRIADELLRYKRIQLFMFEPKNYLHLGNIEYKLNDDEFIILESLLTNEYFEDLIPFQKSVHVNNITYELANPSISTKYDNYLPLQSQQMTVVETPAFNDEMAIQCIKETREVVGNSTSYWKNLLPKSCKEIIFNNTNRCSFYIMITILQQKLNTLFSVEQLKTTLCDFYRNYMDEYKTKIEDTLFAQGKREIINKVRTQSVTLETIIMSETYYLTNLDIWILAYELDIPIILFSTNPFKNMVPGINWLVLSKTVNTVIDNKVHFIRSPPDYEFNKTPEYHLITPVLEIREIKGFENMLGSARSGGEYKKCITRFTDFLKM